MERTYHISVCGVCIVAHVLKVTPVAFAPLTSQQHPGDAAGSPGTRVA